MVFSARVATVGLPAPVRLELPDGRRVTVSAGSEGARIMRAFTLPPGASSLGLDTGAASASAAPRDRRRGFYVQVLDAELEPAVFGRAADLVARAAQGRPVT